MKTIKYFAVISLLAGMSGCNSKPDLDGFREVEISNNMLDTIPENRLNNYKETIEKTYLVVWYWVQPVVRRKAVRLD